MKIKRLKTENMAFYIPRGSGGKVACLCFLLSEFEDKKPVSALGFYLLNGHNQLVKTDQKVSQYTFDAK